MSAVYDNWERIVAAVIKKQQLWELFHQQSRSPSVSSESSSSFSFNLNSSLDEVPFSFTGTEIGDLIPNGDVSVDGSGGRKDFPDNPLSSTQPRRRRNLKIEVPPNPLQHGFALGAGPDYGRYLHPEGRSPSPIAIFTVQNAASTPPHWPDDAKRQSYPLPLPPAGALITSSASPGKRWKKGKLIGVGQFGKIYVGFCSETGEMCAMKEVELLDFDAESSAKAMEKEIAMLSRLRHPNILCYYGSETVGNSFYMYTEYVSGGSISSVLAEYGKLGESVIRNYTQQLLSVLSYLHSKNITHGDIKGANVLVDPNGLVKLGNFAVEKNIARRSRPLLHLENPYWMAPEAVMNPNLQSSAVDVWGLGCTIIEMATRESPWSQYKEGLAIFKIVNKERPTIPDHFSDECKDFLRQCLQCNPLHRATVFQLLEHPFVKVSSPLKKRTVSSASFNEIVSRRLPNLSSAATPKSIIQASDLYTPRKTSSPGSPVMSPLPRPFSPKHLNQIASPPHISSSGAYLQLNKHDMHPNTSSSHKNSSNNLAYWDPKILLGNNTQLSYRESKETIHNSICDDEHLLRFKGAAASSDQSILAYLVSQKLMHGTLH